MPLNMVKSREKANNCGLNLEIGTCNQDAVRVLSHDAHVIVPVAFRHDCVPGAIEKPDGAKKNFTGVSQKCVRNQCARTVLVLTRPRPSRAR